MTKQQHALISATQLAAAGLIRQEDATEIARVADAFAVSITPQMHSLIDLMDPADPIAAQFVPSAEEMKWAPEELADPIGDEAHSPVPGIVHRYPDRVLFKLVNVCPVYCRFCFRRETVGASLEGLDEQAIERALAYIESREEIWEVIVSGGDPFALSARRLRAVMQRLEAAAHVGVVRFHTRVPVVKPERIDADLLAALKIRKAVYVVLHANHVRELSAEARSACAKLIDAGLPMLSQTVLLKGVNASADSLKALFKNLVEMRIKPYYLHHGDLARGTAHFRTSIAAGQELMRSLRGHISGLCQPTYVLDIPGGHGKVPIGPTYLSEVSDGHYRVCDRLGHSHPYIDRAAVPD
jgi:lysine 2,3-aminomutase